MEQLKAGRELDALIAEKVMGISPESMRTPILWNVSADVPHYSTDISAAWQVVEKLRFPFWVTVGAFDGRFGFPPGQFNCNIGEYEKDAWGEGIVEKADTAPLAICLAALKAVGVEYGTSRTQTDR